MILLLGGEGAQRKIRAVHEEQEFERGLDRGRGRGRDRVVHDGPGRSDGSCRRERLTWISPQRGILVFSNHHGQGAIQISPEDLAERVAGHEAMLIFDQPAADTSRDTA